VGFTRLYLEVETCAQKDEEEENDPKDDVFLRDQVIAIGALLRRPSENPSTCIIHDSNLRLFTERRSGDESYLIREFYKWFIQLTQSEKIVVIGFDILRYDIPLLIQKGFEYGVGNIAELNKLWHNTHVIDYQQVALQYYNFPGKPTFPSLVEVVKETDVNVSKLCSSDGNVNTSKKARICKKVNEDGEYNKIVECLRAKLEALCNIDLNFKHFLRRKCYTIMMPSLSI